MSVQHILAGKGRSTVTIAADATLAAAARLLTEHRIGAVLILDEHDDVAGILSERDIVRAVAQGGEAAFSDPVSARMSRNVATCSGHAKLPEIMAMMTDGKFRHVPVIEDGRLAGMISIGDVVKSRLAEMEAEQQAMRDYIATA